MIGPADAAVKVPDHNSNPWLTTTRRLAREVAVDDYVYVVGASAKPPASGLDLRLRWLTIVGFLVIGALIG